MPETAAPLDDDALTGYRRHFGLLVEPFSLTPDPSFLFPSAGHVEALAGLRIGLLECSGLLVLTGEVGTGKTTLLYSLLSDLGPRLHTAYISNTSLAFEDLLRSALRDLGAKLPRNRRRLDLLQALNNFLAQCAEKDEVAVLVIDEAQNLPDAAFEELRLLLNFETYKRKLLQIVLVGQPELDARLRRFSLRQVADRIAVRVHLNPLGRREAHRYIDHRLRAAGSSSSIFTRSALALLVRKSGGVPRRMNVLCHNAMLFAYGRDQRLVDRTAAAAAARVVAGKGLVRQRPSWRALGTALAEHLWGPRAGSASDNASDTVSKVAASKVTASKVTADPADGVGLRSDSRR